VNLDPCLYHFQLFWRHSAIKDQPIVNRNCGLFALVSNMNMWQMVTAIVSKKHQDKDSVEHADGRHDKTPKRQRENHSLHQSHPRRAQDRDSLVRMAKKGEVMVLDVRPSEEFLAAHLPFVRSIPIGELKLRLSELPKGKTVVAYCRGPYCLMARDAVELLRKKGYEAV
jgi:rhodanese-related sulfurtransferase